MEQHHWQPINFKAVDQQYKAAQTARVKAMEDARIAQTTRRLAEQARLQQQAQEQASAAQAAQPVRGAAALSHSIRHAKRNFFSVHWYFNRPPRRANPPWQMPRAGQLPRITNEMIAQEEAPYSALARQAEAQRLVQSTAPAPQPVVPVQAAAPPPRRTGSCGTEARNCSRGASAREGIRFHVGAGLERSSLEGSRTACGGAHTCRARRARPHRLACAFQACAHHTIEDHR